MMRAAFGALLGHWRRNPLQLFTLLAGLALATGLWSGVQAINAEARASYAAAASALDEGRYDRLVAGDGGPMAQDVYIALRRAGWQVSPVVTGDLANVRLVGIDPLTAPAGLGPVDLGGDLDLAAFLTGGALVLANATTAKTLRALPDVQLRVTADLADGTAISDIGAAQSLLGRAGQIDYLLVLPAQPLGVPPLAQIAPDLVRQLATGGSDIAALTDSFHLNLTAFGLLSFAVGIFIVHGAIGLAFEQRRGMMRSLRALGLPLRHLIGLMVAELAVFAALAGGLGVALGYGIAALLLPDVAATLRGLYGADVAGDLQLRPIWWLSGLGIALGGTALAGASALWALARMPLLAGAQPRALAMAAGRRARWQAGAALVLLGLAGVLVFVADGLAAGFALLGALLIGAALALPPILGAVLAWASGRARRPIAQWFWADTRQQLPGLSLALMALLLAIAANTGVSTMVSSFRLTFTAFLDQRLAAELYISTQDAEQTAALIAFAQQRGAAVLPIQSAPALIGGHRAEVFGTRDHTTYRDNWRFLAAMPDAWDSTFAGAAVVINEQLARRAALGLGDLVTVAGQSLPVAGIYGDYGNPIGQIVLAEGLFTAAYPQIAQRQFGLRIDGPTDAFIRDLTATTTIGAGQMIDQAGIKALSLAIFERTFTVTTALNVLTLAVAGFAILMALLTLAAMRLPQLAPAWAMGLTRRQLGGLELLRAVMLAAGVSALALPLGLALAWVLLAVVNVAAFGWRLPMYLFPLDYLRLGGFALVAAVLAAGWPAWRLARTPPSDLLKVFANER